jgi:hypothetical protein
VVRGAVTLSACCELLTEEFVAAEQGECPLDILATSTASQACADDREAAFASCAESSVPVSISGLDQGIVMDLNADLNGRRLYEPSF